jgi:hypothetical protein
VHEHALTLLQVRELVQRIPRGQEDGRDGRRLLKREAVGDGNRPASVGRGVPAERGQGHGHDPVSGLQRRVARADAGDHAGALDAQGDDRPRIHPESHQDVAEVEPRGAHLDLDLARTWCPALRRDGADGVEGALALGLEVIVSDRRRRRQRWRLCQTRDVARALAPRNLALVVGGGNLAREHVGERRIRRPHLDVDERATQLGLLLGDGSPEAPDGRRGKRNRIACGGRERPARHPPEPCLPACGYERLHQRQAVDGRLHRRIGGAARSPRADDVVRPGGAQPGGVHDLRRRAERAESDAEGRRRLGARDRYDGPPAWRLRARRGLRPLPRER